jgi:hypothetical protein
MYDLSEDRLVKLVERLVVEDSGLLKAEGKGSISLELGKKTELSDRGYPVLKFERSGGRFLLATFEMSSDFPDVVSQRDMSMEEMVSFARVARRAVLGEELASEMIKKVRGILIGEKIKIDSALRQIG